MIPLIETNRSNIHLIAYCAYLSVLIIATAILFRTPGTPRVRSLCGVSSQGQHSMSLRTNTHIQQSSCLNEMVTGKISSPEILPADGANMLPNPFLPSAGCVIGKECSNLGLK